MLPFSFFTSLQEMQIHFSGGAKYGQVVFLGGGGGSGKGFAIEKFIQGENFRAIDVDTFKKQLIKLGQRGVPGYEKFKDYDLSNPKDVFALHGEAKKMNLLHKVVKTFARANEGNKNLPNLLFDMTLKDNDDLNWIVEDLHKIGYDPRNIHLLWVLTNFSQAVKQNRERGQKPGGRTVPDDVLLGTHEGAAMNITRMFQGKLPKGLDGKVAVVLNNVETQKMIQNQKKQAYPERRGGFKYLIIKKEGQPMMLDNHRKRGMMMSWIRDNIPRTAKTSTLWPKGQSSTLFTSNEKRDTT